LPRTSDFGLCNSDSSICFIFPSDPVDIRYGGVWPARMRGLAVLPLTCSSSPLTSILSIAEAGQCVTRVDVARPSWPWPKPTRAVGSIRFGVSGVACGTVIPRMPEGQEQVRKRKSKVKAGAAGDSALPAALSSRTTAKDLALPAFPPWVLPFLVTRHSSLVFLNFTTFLFINIMERRL
jgi:hypothetical protein